MQAWDVGTKIMVLDCGGGTVDITTHNVVSVSPVALEELHEPTGGPWGSTMVDKKFNGFLKVPLPLAACVAQNTFQCPIALLHRPYLLLLDLAARSRCTAPEQRLKAYGV